MKSTTITTARCAALVLALAAPGCFWATTKSEGKALRRDVNALESRVATKEGNLDAQITELKRVLDEATKLLKRNSADLGAEVQATQEELRALRGLVTAANEVKIAVDKLRSDHDDRLSGLETRLAALEQKAATPTNPEELWNLGKTAFAAGRHDEARELFKRLAVQFPQHERADDAQYFRGESHFAQSDWESAIREYQKVFDKYPDGALADDALFRAGEAAEKLKHCTEARAYFGLLRQKYGKSELVKKAGQKDKELKANAKDKAKCSS